MAAFLGGTLDRIALEIGAWALVDFGGGIAELRDIHHISELSEAAVRQRLNCIPSASFGFAFGPGFCFRRIKPLCLSHEAAKESSPSGRPVCVASAKRPWISASARPSANAVRHKPGVQSRAQSRRLIHGFRDDGSKCVRALLQRHSSLLATIPDSRCRMLSKQA